MQDQDDELLRLAGLYRVLKPHLAVYYRHHAAVTDQVCDSPTVRTLKFILIDEEEHIRWGQAIYEELADTPAKRRHGARVADAPRRDPGGFGRRDRRHVASLIQNSAKNLGGGRLNGRARPPSRIRRLQQARCPRLKRRSAKRRTQG